MLVFKDSYFKMWIHFQVQRYWYPPVGIYSLLELFSSNKTLIWGYLENAFLSYHKENSLIFKWAKDLEQTLNVQMAKELVNRCSAARVTRKLHVETTVWCHYLLEWPKSKIVTLPPVDEVRQQEISFTAGGSANGCNHSRK